jgi:hypothetical protein
MGPEKTDDAWRMDSGVTTGNTGQIALFYGSRTDPATVGGIVLSLEEHSMYTISTAKSTGISARYNPPPPLGSLPTGSSAMKKKGQAWFTYPCLSFGCPSAAEQRTACY